MTDETEQSAPHHLYFSPSKHGFYDSQVHTEIPADACLCTEEEYLAALEAQNNGKVITVESGHVVAVDPPAPSADVLWARVRLRRNALLAQSDKTILLDYPGNPDKLQARYDYRAALRELPESQTDPAIIEWPESPE